MMSDRTNSMVRHGSTSISRLLLYACLFAVTLAALAPILWIVSTSLKTTDEIFSGDINWIPRDITLDNYRRAFTDYPLVGWMINSILITVWTIIVSTVLYLMPAYALAKLSFRLKPVLMVILLATIMIPKELSALPVYKLIRDLGLLDTRGAVVIPQVAEAIGVFLLVQFFASLPDEYVEAALMDGASHWTILWRIFVPLSGPVIAVTIILTFISSWNNFFWPLLVTFTEQSVTLPVGLSTIMASYSEASAARQYGLLMAISLIGSLPTILVFLALQNKFVEAVTASGLKG